jgi:hypothetical protein
LRRRSELTFVDRVPPRIQARLDPASSSQLPSLM